MKTKIALFTITSFLFFYGCNTVENPTGLMDKLDVENDRLTQEQLEIRNNLKQLSLLLTGMDWTESIKREISFATKFGYEVLKHDEFVTFKDLLSETSSYKNKFKSIEGESFSDKFNALIKNRHQKSNDSYSVDLVEFLKKENIVIYFPYRENFENSDKIFTVTYTPLDNYDVNEGFLIDSIKSKNGSGEIANNIIVDDSYALENPTLILGASSEFCEEETAILECGGGGGGGTGGTGGGSTGLETVASSTHYVTPALSTTNSALQVFLGEVRLESQLDGLFAGGSEVRWLFTLALKLTNSSSVELKTVKAGKDFSRSDVNYKRWKTRNTVVQDNWQEFQLVMPIKMYEADGQGTTEVTTSTQIKLADNNTTTLTQKYNISKSNDHIGDRYLDRQVYLADNNRNTGFGTRVDLYGKTTAVYKAGPLKWTLPSRTINF